MENAIFQLTGRGPLDRALRRIHLLTPDHAHFAARVAFTISINWLPLLFLTAYEGHLFNFGNAIGFLNDFAIHFRFLVSLPLLIIFEALLNKRLGTAVQLFIDRDLIAPLHLPDFHYAAQKASRLLDSIWPEMILFMLAFVLTLMNIHGDLPSDFPSWRALTPEPESVPVSIIWLKSISLPLFRFVIFRWIWRFTVWSWLLWRISKMKLQLIATHPDQCGGIAFVEIAQTTFAAIVFALMIGSAAGIGEHVIYGGEPIEAYLEAVLILIVAVCVTVRFPLIFFTGILVKTRRQGEIKFGGLAMNYVRAFDRKWVTSNEVPEEPLLGTADLQSLADLGNSYNLARQMKKVLLNLDSIKALVFATAFPMLPLILTLVPEKRMALFMRIIKGLF